MDTAPVRQAARTPMLPVVFGSGCMVLAQHLRMVVWPRKFWPHLLEKYDWSVNPTEFLQIYSTLIRAAGGGHDGQLFPSGHDRYGPVVAHEPAQGVPHLQGRAVLVVHGQLRERLCSSRQRG
jgi:hypothetical protein